MDSRYVERQFLAGGRFSSVYKAKDQSNNGKLVALKITTPEDDRPPHNSKDELRLLKFLEEREASKNNVVSILEAYESDFIDLVMVFPYLPFTLTQYLKHHSTKIRSTFNPYTSFETDDNDTENRKPRYENNLSLSKAKEIILGIAKGLSFLHENGIIHRDIKPANILFQNLNSNPVIIDFGISYFYPDNFGREPSENKICDISTSIYKAPELLFGISDYSYGVDIWSFGILITSLFSNNTDPVFHNEDVGDFRLASLIFETFGMPTLKTWPEAEKSKTFGRLELVEREGKGIDSILPRSDPLVKSIFKKMMIYESSQRISSKKIVEMLNTLQNEVT